MAQSSRPTSSNALTQLVHQVAHNFVGGQAVIFNGTWIRAQADSEVHCAGTWMVSIIIDADNFYVTQEGNVGPFTADAKNDVPYTPGVQYYLSQTLGHLTTVKPTTVGQVLLPCFIADSTTTGYFYGGSGNLIQSSSGISWNIATVNTVMSSNNGYVINGGGTLTMTLPPTSVPGDIVEIAGRSAGGWIVAQTDQIIHFGNMSTTLGGGGSLASNVRYDSIKLISITASPNAEWIVLTADGNITIV